MVTMNDVYESSGKLLSYDNKIKMVKSVRAKAGLDLQVTFMDDSILTVNYSMLYDIKIT